MKNNATRTIRSEEITIDVRICAALAANRGGEVYLAAIAPDMELTVITLDEAPGILPCFEENAALLELPRSESQTVLRHLHCSVRLTQVELSVALVTVHSCHKAS